MWAQWHDKGFAPWHAIGVPREKNTRDSVRGDAWRRGSGDVVGAIRYS